MAEPQPSLITGVFRRPFAEQVAFFRNKLGNLVPTQFWDDLQKSAHDTGFMVAGAAKADLLSDLAAAVDRAIAEGTTIEQFRQDFRGIVAKHGWTGWTGEQTAAGRAWRTRIIYVTNARTSYHAGRLAQLRDGNFPLWVYLHDDSVEHPRVLHVSWNGITLPPGHIFWTTHYTPNGWGCHCYVVGARSAASARRLGGNPDKPLPEGWDAIDPKAGEQMGIDKGWGYMPGDTVSNTVREMAAKTQQWDYTLAKAYMQGVPEGSRDALATAYRDLPSVADDTRRYVQRVPASGSVAGIPPQTLGLLTEAQAARVAQLTGTAPQLFDFAVDASAVMHIRSSHGDAQVEAARGQQAIADADFALLPQLLNQGTILAARPGDVSASGHPVIRIEAVINDQRVVASFEIRRKRRMLALLSYWLGFKKTSP
ncbi:MAG: phage minor head protein [Rhodanobacter sp.]